MASDGLSTTTRLVALFLSSLAACGGALNTSAETTSTSASGSGGAAGEGGSGGMGGADLQEPCEGYLDVSIDDGPQRRYAASCPESWLWGGQTWQSAEQATAYGWVSSGVPNATTILLNAVACTSGDLGAEGFQFAVDDATAVGEYINPWQGYAIWHDGTGNAHGGCCDPFRMDLTRIDAVGGIIEGTFTADPGFGPGNPKHIVGAMHVCRAPDQGI
jgi:hypothetical protein